MNAPKILSALVCDDVRIEDTGKHIIIGVYTGDIVVNRTPISISVVIWLQLKDIGEQKRDLEMRGKFQNRDVFQGGLEAYSDDPDNLVTIRTPKIPFQIDGEGNLKVDIRFEGGRWKNIIVKKIRTS